MELSNSPHQNVTLKVGWNCQKHHFQYCKLTKGIHPTKQNLFMKTTETQILKVWIPASLHRVDPICFLASLSVVLTRTWQTETSLLMPLLWETHLTWRTANYSWHLHGKQPGSLLQANSLPEGEVLFQASSEPEQSIQLLSCVWLCDPMYCSTLDYPVHHQHPELALTRVHQVSDVICNHLTLCHHLLLPPSIFLSIRVFSNESALHIRWSKYWNFSFNISPSNEYSGWVSFMIDLFDLLEVQETLKSLLQHHSSKVSVSWCSAFFMIQLSHPHMTTGKIIALTRWTFFNKVMSLLLICCLSLSSPFFQGASTFKFHGCSHHLQWFWSPRK